MNFINRFLLSAGILASFLFSTILPATVAAANCANPTTTQDQIACGVNDAAGKSNANPNDLGDTAKKIVNILSAVVGAIAVIMIIVGGLRFITSAGNEASIKSARGTIIYAVVGLVIVALAQIIVHFVIHTTTTNTP
jgi:cytochrome bd-type quinol oxidase subunit 2